MVSTPQSPWAAVGNKTQFTAMAWARAQAGKATEAGVASAPAAASAPAEPVAGTPMTK